MPNLFADNKKKKKKSVKTDQGNLENCTKYILIFVVETLN